MDLGISGRVAVVTGGDSGMGLDSARLLAREGVRVVLSDKDEDSLRKGRGRGRGRGARGRGRPDAARRRRAPGA